MSRYHVGFVTAAAAAAAALFDIRTNTTARAKILEIGMFCTAATAVTLSLERQTTLGTASTTVVPQAGEPGDPAATALLGTAWSVAPASTAVPLRRMAIPANIGAGVIWTFGIGDLIIPISSSIIMMNRGGAASGIMTGYVTFDE